MKNIFICFAFNKIFIIPIVVSSRGQIDDIIPAHNLFRPDEIAEVTVNYSGDIGTGLPIVTGFLLNPKDNEATSISFATQIEGSAVLQYQLPEGPYGGYGLKAWVHITGGNIVNFSTKDTRRVDMVFGIGYSDDIDKAKECIRNIIENDERVLKDPKPQIVVSQLADSSVNFNVRPWVNSADYWSVYFDTQENVKKTFDEQNISIPFPQRDVHVFNN